MVIKGKSPLFLFGISIIVFHFFSFILVAQNTDWMFACGKSSLNPTPAFNKYLFTGNDEGILYAVDPQKGKSLWSFNAESAILQPPLVNENVAFLCSKNGDVFALNADNGDLIWKQGFSQKFQATPVIAGELLIVLSREYLMGLDKEVGIDLWRTEVKITGTPKIQLLDGKLFFSDDMSVYSFDAKNGALLWKYETNVFGLSDICCANGLGYMISGDRLICIDLTKGTEKWKKKMEYPQKPKFFNIPVVIDNLLVVTYLSDVIAFDPQKGTEIWTYETKSTNELFHAEFMNLMIWIPERGKTMYLLSPEKGKKGKPMLFDEPMNCHPVFDKTKLFYINGDGKLLSVKLL